MINIIDFLTIGQLWLLGSIVILLSVNAFLYATSDCSNGKMYPDVYSVEGSWVLVTLVGNIILGCIIAGIVIATIIINWNVPQ